MPAELATAFAEAESFLARAARPLLITHSKADGDALGSLLAMRAFLTARDARPLAMPFEPMPPRYVALRRYDPMPIWARDVAEADLDDVDAVVVLDTCSYKQLEPLAEWLKASRLPKIAIDHHATRDDLADVYVIDDSASAASLVLHEMATALGWPIDAVARDALFVGIATDTGWFRHSNTDARTLRAASELLAAGADANALFQMLYQTDSPGRIRLLGHVLSGMELCCEERLAMLAVERGVIDRLGARMSDTEDMINEPLRIGSVVASVLLIEQDDGVVRASFRSKAPADGEIPDIDVAAIAQSLGGGGHRRAAGARVAGTLGEVRTRIVDLLQARLAETPN